MDCRTTFFGTDSLFCNFTTVSIKESEANYFFIRFFIKQEFYENLAHRVVVVIKGISGSHSVVLRNKCSIHII